MSLKHTELSSMLETAIVAARLAGQRATEEMRYTHKSIKNGSEIITQADPICQKVIINRIRESFPDHGFLAEEGQEGAMFRIEPRSDESIWWIIDPIDGTNNFANGLLCFSVSIAAMHQDKPIVGVIFDPCTDSMYTAAQDMDAMLNGSRITVSEDPIGRFSSFGVDSHEHPAVDAAKQEIMKRTRFRCFGSTALHLAYVAKGAMIGAVTPLAKLWDIAAGIILVEQAGGVVLDLDTKSPISINPNDYQGQAIPTLATSKKVNSEILELFS